MGLMIKASPALKTAVDLISKIVNLIFDIHCK